MVLYVVWVGSPPSNEPTTLPSWSPECGQGGTQSMHQVSWRDYNGVPYKESPQSYGWNPDGLPKHVAFAGFMTYVAGANGGAMYTRG